MLPTKTAVALAQASHINTLFKDQLLWKQHLGHFQRLSLVADYDTASMVIQPYLAKNIDPQSKVVLTVIHDLAKNDVLGLAVEALLDMAETSKNGKDKLAAATIINELYGEKDLVSDVKLTDRLMINLVGGT
jgi:hypothetical protein